MTGSFDRFIAVDWSGSKGAIQSGIAVAVCAKGGPPPSCIGGPKAKWGRSKFVDWVGSIPASEGRVLLGIDCAFALPDAVGTQLLGADYSAADLWQLVDQIAAEDMNYYGGSFAEHADHRHLYWSSGARPSSFVEHKRSTERACAAAGLGHPETPLKLIGPKQVGKGSLAGMRVLHALKQRMGNEFAVWPFDQAEMARIVCVEIFPRLFLRMAQHGTSKLDSGQLNERLAALGSRPIERIEFLKDHHTDALISAVGMRRIAANPSVWNPSGLSESARQREGWIFGVT